MTPQELKNSILLRAIQGKLVEQRPEEGTGEELFCEIQRKKAELIKNGTITKGKASSEVTNDELLFDIPESWKWVRIDDVVLEKNDGVHFAPKYISAGIPCYSAKDIYEDAIHNEKCNYISDEDYYILMEGKINTKVGSLLFTKSGSIGRSTVLSNWYKFGLVESVGVLNFCTLDPEYVKLVFDWGFVYGYSLFNTYTKGIAVKHLTLTLVGTIAIPLPPLAEQHRIVAKIEELLPLIDRYEKAYTKLEDFNKRFPVDMQKSILQMAIQGKLVEQRSEEGTGEELYQQIQAEKNKLIKAGKIKKEKPLPEISEDEIPFEIPENWKWVHLIDVCIMIGDIDHKMPVKVDYGGVPYISPLDFTPTGIDYDKAKQISKKDFIQLGKKFTPQRHDIIFPRYGTIGVVRKVETDREFLVSYSCCTIRTAEKYLLPDYVYYTLQTPMIKNEINKYINKTTQPNVGLASIKQFLFPLPPISEQKRIVAKVNELLPLCAKLNK